MKTFNTILTLIILAVSAVIGYNSNPTAKATEVPTIPRFVDIPRTNGFNLNIDMNSGKVVVNDTRKDISVAIQKKDSIVYRYKTSIVKKPVYIRVRELPAVKENKTFVSPSFTKPMQLCIK